jgi:hypothetical protein
MKIYILTLTTSYEQNIILQGYTSLEEAKEALEKELHELGLEDVNCYSIVETYI